MKRGPKPKPAKLKLLEGNPGKRKVRKEAKGKAGLPHCPRELSADAKRVWKRLAPKFAAVLTVQDEPVFAMLCQEYATYLTCIKAARKDGAVVKINGQPMPNPYSSAAGKAFERVRKLLAEIGGSPAARVRLPVNEKAPEEELIAFLNAG